MTTSVVQTQVQLAYPYPGKKSTPLGNIPQVPDQPRKARHGQKELSFASELHAHLCEVAAWMLREHKQFHPFVRDERGNTPFQHRWTTLSADELAPMLWEYVKTYAGSRIVPESQGFRSSLIGEDQAFRSAVRAAELAVGTWDPYRVESARYKARERQMRATPRGKTVTAEMVLPHLDALRGLTIRQAAERLASWDWDTEKGRHSVDTFRRRLRELDFTGEAGTKRVRSSDIKPEMYAGMDGLTNQGAADELGVSLSTVVRTRPKRVAPMNDTEAEGQTKVQKPEVRTSSTISEAEFNNDKPEVFDPYDPRCYLKADGSTDWAMLFRAVP